MDGRFRWHRNHHLPALRYEPCPAVTGTLLGRPRRPREHRSSQGLTAQSPIVLGGILGATVRNAATGAFLRRERRSDATGKRHDGEARPTARDGARGRPRGRGSEIEPADWCHRHHVPAAAAAEDRAKSSTPLPRAEVSSLGGLGWDSSPEPLRNRRPRGYLRGAWFRDPQMATPPAGPAYSLRGGPAGVTGETAF